MSEYPIFFKKNNVDIKYDLLSASSGGTIVDWAFNNDKNTSWASVGSSDLLQETLDVIFLDADGEKEQRNIDRIILLNHNLKKFHLEYSNWVSGAWSVWATITGTTYTTNAYDNIIISITKTLYNRIRIVMDETITPNAEKYIGEMILTEMIYEMTVPLDAYDVKYISDKKVNRMYAGNGQKISYYEKYGAHIEFQQITQSILESLKDIYDNYGSFYFIPEPYDDAGIPYLIENCYLCIWVSQWNQKYFGDIKSVGLNVSIDLEEI